MRLAMWQLATYNEPMAQSIRISDELYSMAQNASQALGRPLAQQMEYWARLGAALDAAGISTRMAMELLSNGVEADKFLAVALGRMSPENGEEVAAGRRSARSLLMFQKDDLKGYSFTPNPASEFEHSGDGW